MSVYACGVKYSSVGADQLSGPAEPSEAPAASWKEAAAIRRSSQRKPREWIAGWVRSATARIVGHITRFG